MTTRLTRALACAAGTILLAGTAGMAGAATAPTAGAAVQPAPAVAAAAPATALGATPASVASDRKQARAAAQTTMNAITARRAAAVKRSMTPKAYRTYLGTNRQWRGWLADARWQVRGCTRIRGGFSCMAARLPHAIAPEDQVLKVAKVSGVWRVTAIDSAFDC